MKTTPNRTALAYGIILFSMIFLKACNSNKSVGNYEGRPFEDMVYNKGAQKVPGKLQCEYYDKGGEGVAFHDSDSINSGSGGLNKADGSYLHEFRIDEL